MKKSWWSYASWILLILIVLIILIFLVRLFSEREVDDVNPYMICSSQELNRGDTFYVVPLFNNIPINESKEWCNSIIQMNKRLCLHGIKHTYEEFNEDISKEEFNYAIEIFKDCFGYRPTCFKAPQTKINQKNIKLIESYNIKIVGSKNQFFHKVYHCNDSGVLPNWIQNLI